MRLTLNKFTSFPSTGLPGGFRLGIPDPGSVTLGGGHSVEDHYLLKTWNFIGQYLGGGG